MAMVGRLVPVRVGGVDVLVEAVTPPGSEPTSGRVDEVARKVSEAFDRAQDAIVEIAVKTAGTVRAMGARAVRPEKVAVEFGVSFTATGGVVIAGASAQASLKVTITYDRPDAVVAPAGPTGAAAT